MDFVDAYGVNGVELMQECGLFGWGEGGVEGEYVCLVCGFVEGFEGFVFARHDFVSV